MGKHLTDISLGNRLTCLKTNFQKRERNLWTYTYPNKAKTQIGYILIKKKWINRALNCVEYLAFEGVSSNHRIFAAKIRLSLRRNKTQTAKTTRYSLSSLNNRDINNKYMVSLRNKFDTLQEISETLTPNNEYENFFNAYMEAATECILTKPRAKGRFPWETIAIKKKEKWCENSILL